MNSGQGRQFFLHTVLSGPEEMSDEDAMAEAEQAEVDAKERQDEQFAQEIPAPGYSVRVMTGFENVTAPAVLVMPASSAPKGHRQISPGQSAAAIAAERRPGFADRNDQKP